MQFAWDLPRSSWEKMRRKLSDSSLDNWTLTLKRFPLWGKNRKANPSVPLLCWCHYSYTSMHSPNCRSLDHKLYDHPTHDPPSDPGSQWVKNSIDVPPKIALYRPSSSESIPSISVEATIKQKEQDKTLWSPRSPGQEEGWPHEVGHSCDHTMAASKQP